MKSLKKKSIFEVTRIEDEIRRFYDRNEVNKLGRQLGFLKREGKIDALDFILNVLLTLDKLGANCSLSDICHELYKNLGVQLKPQSLNERFNDQAVELCHTLFKKALVYQLGSEVKLDILDCFKGIWLEDSTHINLPESLLDLYKGYGSPSRKSALKINFCMDLQSTALDWRLKSAVDNDQNGLTMGAAKSSLWLRDLGYFKYEKFQNLSSSQAYFISRLQSGSGIYTQSKYRDKQQLDLLKLRDELKDNEVYDQPLYLGYKHRWKARIVVIKLPKQKREEKIARLKASRKKKNKKLSEQVLQMAPINVFITNLPKSLCQADMLWALYTVRWQIELMFKAWKTNYKIDQMKKKLKPQRALCQLYIQLIHIILNTKLLRFLKVKVGRSMKKEISQLSGMKKIKSWTRDIYSGICSSRLSRVRFKRIYYQMIEELINTTCKKLNRANANKFFSMCYFYT